MRARLRGRRGTAGFTLVELMVVVVIVSVLTALAIPSMRAARNERLTFDFARRVEQLVQRAHARSAGRGAAHLVIAAPTGTPSRGEYLLFEALDGSNGAGGPNPVSTCKAAGEWTDVTTFVPGAPASNTARIIDGFNIDTGAATTTVNATADIRSTFYLAGTVVGALAICVTPSGNTYVGAAAAGGSIGDAINNMQAQVLPFAQSAEMRITRGDPNSATVGIARRVLVAGSAASRIKSD